MQRDGLDEYCLRDSCPTVCNKLLIASSMPVTVKHQGHLQRTHRIALRVDDKDPAFLCRLKVVVTWPTTECHRICGGLLKDCRHDADSTTTEIMNLVDERAMKRQGRRDAIGVVGPNNKMDEELRNSILRKIFCCCSDGAEVMVNAIPKLKSGGASRI